MLDESLALPLLDQTSLEESTDIEPILVDPLIYDDTVDTSTIQNVLFINSSVNDFQQYANANTFPIIYSRMSTREQLMELLAIKFQNIPRIALVCHFSEEPYFLNNELLFSDTNTQFIIDLVKQFNVTNMDFLACSTLQSEVWTSYYTKLRDATGTQIGASDDNTGNLKYGGDWVMESTQEDVQTVYFNNLIQNYASLLLSITYLNLNYTTVGSSATVIAPTAAQVTALNGIINIPSTFIDNGIPYNVVAIAASAFQGTAITSVIIPDSVTTIGIRVFQSCTLLKTVTLPNVITSISAFCFQWCYELTSIVIPSLVTIIEHQAFYQCVRLANIVLPDGLLTIGQSVFPNNAFTSIIIPNSLTTFGNSVFYSSLLSSIKLPNNFTVIAGGLFQATKLAGSFIIPSKVTSIGGSAFQSCNLSSVTIPGGVTNIGNQAFFDCNSLSKVYFYGNYPSTIGTNCFAIGTAHTAYYIAGATGFSTLPTGYFVGAATFIQQTPASNVQTSVLSLNTITVSWTAATPVVNVPSTGTTLKYEIIYWVTSTPTITTTTPLISGTSYDITNLVNGTNYTFQLVTYNDVGPSIPNENVSKQMTPETPSAPISFKITPRNGQILISQIVDGTNNGAIIDYHSYSTSLDGISNWTTDVSFSTISTLIPSLTNEQIYYVRLNTHNSVGNSTLYSSIMSATPLINQPYTGSVTIEGTTNRYNTLTANISTIADIDELGSFSYQWNASGVDISGATSITYILTQAEVGKTVGVTVKYTDLQGTLESVPSAQTAIITALNNPPYGLVIITGTAAIRQTLTANTSIEDLDIVGSLSYQWDASGVNISGATNSTYTLTLAEVGKTVGVTVKYTDSHGTLESVSSAKTSIVAYVISTSDFVFKILNSVWTGAKTLPIISSGLSFDGSATLKYSVTGPDAGSNVTVAVIYSGFTDNGTTLDGINCKTQTLNGATFSSIASFEIIQFGLFPLSRAPGAGSSTATPYGVFSDFNGKISATDTPLILPNTSLAFAFCSAAVNTLASINFGNIGSWNMVNVTNMSYMFHFATNFNQPISSWNTSNVTNMSYMFFRTNAFNQPIGVWNTGKVTNFSAMFYGTAATLFNQNLSNWDTSSAINMSLMFIGGRFNNGLAVGVGGTFTWNTRLVQDFSFMFGYQNWFNQNVGKFDTSSAITMNSMFFGNTVFNNGAASGVLNATNNAFYWNTGNVTNMVSMFNQATGFNQHIGTFDTRKISTANMLNMVAYATAFNNASTNMPRAILTNGTRYSYATLTGYGYTSDELNASKPTGLSASRSGTILTINFTTPSYPGVNEITKYNYSIDGGTNWMDASGTTSPLLISVPEMDTLTIKLRASDASNNYGSISSETIVLIFVYLPSLTAIANPINLGSVSEDASNVEISFSQLFQDTTSNSINSSVNAFIVKSVTTGSLKIGVNPWDASLNCTIDASNTAYWTPVLKANGTLTAFKIVARDDFMEQSTTPFNVNVMVTAVNDRPIITSSNSVTVFENVTAAYTVIASDVDAGTTLVYSFNGGVDDDSFNINSSTGAVTFKVSPNFEAPGGANLDNVYNIIVRASDGELYSDNREVEIRVINVNDVPVASVLIDQPVIQDVSFNYTFEAFTDEDSSYGDTLSYTASNVPSWVTFNSETKNFSGLPTNANVGTSTITVTAKDSSNATAFASFILTVRNVNDAPTITCVSDVRVPENIPTTQILLIAVSNDVDVNATNTFSITGTDASWCSINSSGELTFKESPDYETKSSYSINVVTTDTEQGELYALQAVTITIENANDAPTITCVSDVTVSENISTTQVLLTAVSNDVDASASNTFLITGTDASWCNINSLGQLKFNVSPNYEVKSSYSINVVTTDTVQTGLYASQAVTIAIQNVNDAPVKSVLINQTIDQDVSFNYTFDAFTDVDFGDELSYTALNVPSWVTFDPDSRNFSGLPTNADVGQTTITVIGTDLSGATDSGTFILTVLNVNDSPAGGVSISGIVRQHQTLTADTSLLVDIDGLGSFSYQWDASGVDISGATSSTFVLTQAQVGKPIGVTIKYTDLRGSLETVSSEKTAPVENVNDDPTISETQTVALPKGSLIKSGTTDASDIDIGAVLTWSITNKTGRYGSIDISSNTGEWQYNLLPNSAAFKALENDLSDNETFIINVSDDTSLTTFQTLKIIITGVTIAAVAPQSFRLTAGDTQITIDNVVDVSNGAIVDFHTYTKSTDGSNWEPDVSLNSTPTPTVLTELTNGQVYYIKLKSYSTIGYSAYSQTLSIIPQIPVVIVGALLDGYIRDATVTIQDLSGGSYGASVITDQNGNFTVSATLQPHTIYIISSVGGTDIATNLPVTSPLTRVHITYITETAVVNISNMFTTPLTTIVANIVTGGETIEVATTKIASAMGITESDITTDYIGVPNVAVGVAAVKVATLVNMMVAASSSQGYTGEEISKAVSQALFNSPGTGPVDFTSPALITSITAAADVINVEAPSISPTTATNVSSIMAQVSTTLDTIQETGSNSVSDLASIYKTSIGAQAIVTDNQDNISNVTIPDVSTALNTAINVATVGNVKGNICFRKGTKVVTDQGIIEIQKITEKNSINGKKILLVSKTTNIDDYMVLIQKDALYNNVPNADTYVTGEHKVFFNREMIKTKKLVNGTTIRKVTALNEEVYNVLLEGDNVGKMIANGLIGETLNPKSMMIELLLKLNKMGLKERTEEIHRLNYFSKMDQDRRMMKK